MQQTNQAGGFKAAVRAWSTTDEDDGDAGFANVAIVSLAGLTLSLVLLCNVFSADAIQLMQQAWLN